MPAVDGATLLPFSPGGRRWPRSGRMRGRRDLSGLRSFEPTIGTVTAPPHPNPLPRGERGAVAVRRFVRLAMKVS